MDTLAVGLGTGTGTGTDMGMGMGMGLALCMFLARAWVASQAEAEAEAAAVELFSSSSSALAGAQSQFWLRNIQPCTGACSRGPWHRRAQKRAPCPCRTPPYQRRTRIVLHEYTRLHGLVGVRNASI